MIRLLLCFCALVGFTSVANAGGCGAVTFQAAPVYNQAVAVQSFRAVPVVVHYAAPQVAVVQKHFVAAAPVVVNSHAVAVQSVPLVQQNIRVRNVNRGFFRGKQRTVSVTRF